MGELARRDSNARVTRLTHACYFWPAKPLRAALSGSGAVEISSACEPEPENRLRCLSRATSGPSRAVATLVLRSGILWQVPYMLHVSSLTFWTVLYIHLPTLPSPSSPPISVTSSPQISVTSSPPMSFHLFSLYSFPLLFLSPSPTPPSFKPYPTIPENKNISPDNPKLLLCCITLYYSVA